MITSTHSLVHCTVTAPKQIGVSQGKQICLRVRGLEHYVKSNKQRVWKFRQNKKKRTVCKRDLILTNDLPYFIIK